MAKMVFSGNLDVDDFDKAILRLVQKSNQLSHRTIGEAVGLSTSAVRRRLARMRSTGIISKDVALLDRSMMGETLFVTVYFLQEMPEIYRAFEQQMATLEEVSQCYHIAGEGDYLLVVNMPTLRHYEEWGVEHLMSNPDIRRYDTIVAYSCKKFDTAVSL